MPTGGVSIDNVGDYFEAGAVAVGAGSALVNYEAIEEGDMDGVRERAADFCRGGRSGAGVTVAPAGPNASSGDLGHV